MYLSAEEFLHLQFATKRAHRRLNIPPGLHLLSWDDKYGVIGFFFSTSEGWVRPVEYLEVIQLRCHYERLLYTTNSENGGAISTVFIESIGYVLTHPGRLIDSHTWDLVGMQVNFSTNT